MERTAGAAAASTVAALRDDPPGRPRRSPASSDRRVPPGRGGIVPRLQTLYAHAATDLDEPRLLDLIRDGAPVYAWPYEHRQVWAAPTHRPWRAH